MLKIHINEPELNFVELFRIALSEESIDQREQAVKTVKHDIVAQRLDLLSLEQGAEWMSASENAEFVQWIAKTERLRHEAAFEFSQTSRRYEDKRVLKLNIAEYIGLLVWLSIQDMKFEGLHTKSGILVQVRDEAKKANVRGARDTDTLRKIWNMYRGVVHLGMAIDYCDNNPTQELNVILLAELFRKGLSENCPKGTSKPYVDATEQISFLYISRIWGPRFEDRGLPFGID